VKTDDDERAVRVALQGLGDQRELGVRHALGIRRAADERLLVLLGHSLPLPLTPLPLT